MDTFLCYPISSSHLDAEIVAIAVWLLGFLFSKNEDIKCNVNFLSGSLLCGQVAETKVSSLMNPFRNVWEIYAVLSGKFMTSAILSGKK